MKFVHKKRLHKIIGWWSHYPIIFLESYLFEEYCVYQILSKYLEICNQSSVFISFIRSIMELLQEKITRRVVILSIYGKKQKD